MNKYDLVVIVPVYNVEKYLSRCLDSLFMQKNVNFYVVCVDDCSTDDSVLVLEQYKKTHSNFLFLKNDKNMGPSYSRNRGLEFLSSLKCDYFMFVDSDDYIINEYYFSSFIKKASLYNCSMVCSNFRNLTIRDKLLDEKGMVDAFCEREILASPCDKLFSNKSHHNILFNEKIKCGEDKEFVVDCLGKSDSVLLTSIQGYFYYNNCDSIMHSHNCSSSELYYKQLSTLKIFEVLARKQYDQVLIDSFCNYFFETFREIKKIDKKTKRFLKNNADKLFKKYELNKRYKPKNKHYWILKFLYNYCTPLYYLI